MKTLIPFLFLAFHSLAQTDTIKEEKDAFSFDETCYRLWWIYNKMGGYDGFEFRPNGELKLLNYDFFLGEKWWIEGDHLFTEIRSRRNGKILKTDYVFKKQTEKWLVLDYVAFDESRTSKYQSIIHDDFTDKLLGHWDGEGDSYIQVIPITSFEFQLVVSMNNKLEVTKYYGYLDEENKTIIFEIDGEESKMEYASVDDELEIRFNNKIYRRSCSK